MTSMATRSRVLFLVFVVGSLLVLAGVASDELYPAQGIHPEAVLQGSMGSCYFHASIAALASTDPKLLTGSILDGGGNYTVHFANGSKELVHPQDVLFARKNGYDRSNGLWVAVLFRGYAQSVLRDALLRAIDKSSFNSFLKSKFHDWIADSDLIFMAYDRAVRSQVDQTGNLNASGLRARLHQELASLPLPDSMKQSAEEMLMSHGVFDAVAAEIRDNGELFGAYRAAGNGGLPERVLRRFTGNGRMVRNAAVSELLRELSAARVQRRAVVASTASSRLEQLQSRGMNPPGAAQWYVPLHAYTVMSFDGSSVTLRNPWGDHPYDSHGVFQVSVNDFAVFFPYLYVQE